MEGGPIPTIRNLRSSNLQNIVPVFRLEHPIGVCSRSLLLEELYSHTHIFGVVNLAGLSPRQKLRPLSDRASSLCLVDYFILFQLLELEFSHRLVALKPSSICIQPVGFDEHGAVVVWEGLECLLGYLLLGRQCLVLRSRYCIGLLCGYLFSFVLSLSVAERPFDAGDEGGNGGRLGLSVRPNLHLFVVDEPTHHPSQPVIYVGQLSCDFCPIQRGLRPAFRPHILHFHLRSLVRLPRTFQAAAPLQPVILAYKPLGVDDHVAKNSWSLQELLGCCCW